MLPIHAHTHTHTHTHTHAASQPASLSLLPQVLTALLRAKEQSDPAGWKSFQSSCQQLKLQRSRAQRQVSDLSDALMAAQREMATRQAGKTGQG